MKLDQQLKVLRLNDLAALGTNAPDVETIQLEPAERGRLLSQVFRIFETNQAFVLQTNTPAPGKTLVALPTNTPPQVVMKPARTENHAAASSAPGPRRLAVTEKKGSALLMTRSKVAPVVTTPATSRAPGGLVSAPGLASVPMTPEGMALTVEQIEAKLLSATQVSDDDLRALMRQRAEAVQSHVVKTGKVSADRLVIASPKPVSSPMKGETRVNLALE